MHATVLNGAVIGEEAVVAAGALVTPGMVVPPRSLVAGVPAKVRREISDGGARAPAPRCARRTSSCKSRYLAADDEREVADPAEWAKLSMIQRPRGTRDLLPPESRLLAGGRGTWRATCSPPSAASEIRTPIFEATELFVRTVGETTDIVHKEMYTFPDRKGRSLTLRPEGTAGVRARLDREPAARAARIRCGCTTSGRCSATSGCSAGRYRQFSQIGLEILGAAAPLADAEMLAAAARVPRRASASTTS